jgi:HK97 family phage prohead protease
MSGIIHGFHIELESKAVGEDGTFVGYASTFDDEDLGKDIVVTGAFDASLARRPAAKIKMLRGHDQANPIGTWIDVRPDSRGLAVKGKLILDTRLGSETHALMRAGALDALSIGYRVPKDGARVDRAAGVRYLKNLDLLEISVVTFGMNPGATISSVKSRDPDQALALIEACNRAVAALRG